MSGDELPPEFADFGDRLEAAARAEIEAEGRTRRRRRGRGQPLLAAVAAAVLAAGAVAGASSLLGDDGPQLPEQRSGSPGTSSPDPAVVPATAVPEALGGPDWAVRVFADKRGHDCAAVGRLRDGRLGVIVEGRFRAQRDIAPGVCGDLARDGLLAVAETRVAPAPRILVYGISPSRNPITVRAGGTTTRVRPQALGAFLVVVAGSLASGEVRVATVVDGRSVTRQLGLTP